MNSLDRCPNCGLELPAGSSPWLCPRCLLTRTATEDIADEEHASPLEDARTPPEADGHAIHPRTLGPYELLEQIGQGGMGIVYRARHTQLDRMVALKILPLHRLANKEFVHRFRTEAVAAGSLQHPNIVSVYEVGLEESQHYIAMEYVPGCTLAEAVQKGALPEKKAARYVQLIADAVHFAHEHGVLHRDLKPSNVLIDFNDQPKITDFGLAKRIGSDIDLTLSGQILGSPGFLSPEQASGRSGLAGRSIDVYSLGAVLFFLLTGRPPFTGPEVADALRQVLNDDPVSPRLLNPGVPVDLETICLKCLEKNPSKRYPTALALSEELGRYLRGEIILSRPVSRIQKTWRWCRRKPAQAGMLASVLALLIVLGIGGPLVAAHQRRLAERNRKLLYTSDMKVAYQTWELGNMPRMVQLLDRNLPEAGQTDLREFTWYYLRELCEPFLRTTTLNHGTPVFTLNVSRDESLLVASGAGDWVTVWDLAGPIKTETFHTGDLYAGSIAFSPDHRLLVTIGGPLKGPAFFNVWDLERGSRLLRKQSTLGMTADFSPDGKWLAAGRKADIVLLNTDDWSEIRSYRGHKETVWDVNFSPDGEMLASCGMDQTIRLWDPGSANTIRILEGHLGTVYSVTFSPDGKRLASAGGDHTVRLWDTQTGAEIGHYAHASFVMGVDFSPDGRTIASGSNDGLTKIWDPETGRIQTLRGHAQAVGDIRFVLGGTRLASGSWDGTVKLWNIRELEIQNELEVKGSVRSWSGMARPPLAIPRDGSEIFTVSRDGQKILIWWTPTGKLLERWMLEPTLEDQLVQSSSGAHSSLIDLAISNLDRTMAIVRQLTEESEPEAKLSQSVIELWNTRDRKMNRAFPGKPPIMFSPDGSWLASGAIETRALQVENIADGRSWTTRLEGTQELVDAVAFSPDGRLLAAACEGNLAIHDAHSGRLKAILTHAADAYPINALAFCPDGRTLAVGRFSTDVELWDTNSRRVIALLPGHLAQVTSVAISPDGKTMATGSQNGTLKLWSLELREELLHLQAHEGGIYSMAFSLDGRILVSCGEDQIARLWRTAPGE